MKDQGPEFAGIVAMGAIAFCTFKAFQDYHRRSLQNDENTTTLETSEINTDTPEPTSDETDSLNGSLSTLVLACFSNIKREISNLAVNASSVFRVEDGKTQHNQTRRQPEISIV